MACEYLSMEVMERWIISKDSEEHNSTSFALYMIHKISHAHDGLGRFGQPLLLLLFYFHFIFL